MIYAEFNVTNSGLASLPFKGTFILKAWTRRNIFPIQDKAYWNMENNFRVTKGNLVLLNCWDIKTPEEETSSMFNFF